MLQSGGKIVVHGNSMGSFIALYGIANTRRLIAAQPVQDPEPVHPRLDLGIDRGLGVGERRRQAERAIAWRQCVAGVIAHHDEPVA